MLRGVLVWERSASYNIAAAGLDLEMTRDMFLPSKAQSLAPKKTVSRNRGIRIGHDARKHNLSPPCVVTRQASIYYVAFSNK